MGGPLNLGQTLDATFKVTRQIFVPLVLLALAIAVPLVIVQSLALGAVTTHYDATAAFSFSFDKSDVDYNSAALFYIVDYGTLLLGSLISGVLIVLAVPLALARARGDQTVTLRESLAISLRLWRPLTVASLLAGSGVLVGLLLCAVPGIYLMIVWLVVIPVVMDEGLSGRESLGRSRQLVVGRWWQTFGRYLIVILITTVVGNFLVRIAVGVIDAGVDGDSTAALWLVQAAEGLAQVITTPLTVAVIAVIYLDLRARAAGATIAVPTERFHGFTPPT